MQNILLDAKREYTEQLVSKLTHPLYDEIYKIWQSVVNDEATESPMREFQDALEELASLSDTDMALITDRCIKTSSCSYIGDIITAVFVSHTRVVLSICKEHTLKDYKLQIPSSKRFLKACLLCCAREFWKAPYLFYHNEFGNKISKVQMQKNLREAEVMVGSAIRYTIRELLPLKDVLDMVLDKTDSDDIMIEYHGDTSNAETKEDDSVIVPDVSKTNIEDVSGALDSIDTSTLDTSGDIVDISEENIHKEIDDAIREIQTKLDEEEQTDNTEHNAAEYHDVSLSDVSGVNAEKFEEEDAAAEEVAAEEVAAEEAVAEEVVAEEDEEDDETEDDSFSRWDNLKLMDGPGSELLEDTFKDAISLDPKSEQVETKQSNMEILDDNEFTIEAEEL